MKRKHLLNAILLALGCIATAVAAAPVSMDELAAALEKTEVAPKEAISLKLSRAIAPQDGRVALMIGSMDVTAFVAVEDETVRYDANRFPIDAGSHDVSLYLVDANGAWTLVSQETLVVAAAIDDGQQMPDENSNAFTTEFTPNVSLNLKSRNEILTFPTDSAPERNPATDLAGQGTININVTKKDFSFRSQFDLAGSSFRQEALRFGDLADRAPLIDLSSYLIEIGKGRFKANLGHVSFGTNRHLLSGFSSRGATVQLPIGKQNEFTIAAVNGTAVVGFGNFLGITKRRHNLLATTFAREFYKDSPGELRIELTAMSGSLLPLSNLNQGEINDAEKSLGGGVRIAGFLAKQKLRYEAGFSRSRFTNPSDPLLEQEDEIVPVRTETKNAYYAEISYDILNDIEIGGGKKLKTTGTVRFEEIAPLFRSIGAFSQADRRRLQFEITGNIGGAGFGFGNLGERDNLANIPSILKTRTRRNNFLFNIPFGSMFSQEKPSIWLPVVSYNFDLTHQYGIALPDGGLFTDPSQVPDQKSYSQNFNAQWTFGEKYGAGFTHTRSFQDNRQPGRENADLATASNTFTFSLRPIERLNLDLDFSRERQKNFETARIDRNFRLGTRGTLRLPYLKNSVLNGGLSFALAGDDLDLNDTRNGEFDLQYSYNFSFGEQKFKKLSGQFFIRYANRYGDSIDRQFLINTLTKSQAFNAGLTINLF
ncbi:MAG: hypothetical protein R2684_17510 [Pyrinomonadaceae bacterium]